MSWIVSPAAIVAAIALLAGLMLALAAKYLSVSQDEKLSLVRALLPGANCGACGCAGCDDYAAKMVNEKQVADGYGRNYLIARGLAVMESEGAKKVLDKQNADAQKLDAENREKAQELKEMLEKRTYEFKVKAKEGKVSGSVSTKQIEEAVKKDGYVIDKRKIINSEPLNQLGTYDVKVELYKDVIATLKVILTEE